MTVILITTCTNTVSKMNNGSTEIEDIVLKEKNSSVFSPCCFHGQQDDSFCIDYYLQAKQYGPGVQNISNPGVFLFSIHDPQSTPPPPPQTAAQFVFFLPKQEILLLLSPAFCLQLSL